MKVAKVHDSMRHRRAHELRLIARAFATVSVFHIHAHEQQLGTTCILPCARVFRVRELELLETLGQLLGIALENLRLAACASARCSFRSVTWWRRLTTIASRKSPSFLSTCKYRYR
jgi:hypothetical protein